MLTEERLFQSQGVNVDLELSLYQADHGNPTGALTSAAAEYARRHSILVEDAFAWALHMNGRDREALPHAAAALRLGTKSALFHFHRGVIEAALGMKPRRSATCEQALALNPHFSALQAPGRALCCTPSVPVNRLVRRLSVAAASTLGVLLLTATGAQAHPLGNFTVNSFSRPCACSRTACSSTT